MSDDGDLLIHLIGAGIVLFIVVAVGVLILAAMNAPSYDTDTPAANWSIERVNDSYARIVHEGGDAVPAEDLVVSVDGYTRKVSWSGAVTDGDAGAFEARTGQRVRLYWTGGRGDRVELANWRAP